jgi:hypothetical protein
MNNQKEEFRDIPNYEGFYQVSNWGRVKSLARTSLRGHQLKEKILSKATGANGYHVVSLHKKNKQKTAYIHKLVSISFLNHLPSNYEIVIDHIDNNPLNNNLINLQLTTCRHNVSKDLKRQSSKYIGVRWSEDNRWVSSIYIINKKIHLGCFKNELEASNMYQKALDNLDKYNGNNSEFRNYLNSL